jgi:cytochrome P450
MSGTRFVPVTPFRPAKLAPPLASLFNEHSRNSVAGWSEAAFEQWHVRRNLLGTIVHIPRHPDAIERVLLANAANYEKPRMVKRVVAPLIGRGLVSSDGELWRTQRKIVAPSFAPGSVNRMIGMMAQAAERSSANWPASGRIDIHATATATTMAIIAETLFSGDPRLTTPAAARNIEAALLAAGQVRLTAILGMTWLRLSKVSRDGEKGRRYLRDTLTAIVRERGPERGRRFPRRHDPEPQREVRRCGGDRAGDRQCRDLLCRGPRDHCQCAGVERSI